MCVVCMPLCVCTYVHAYMHLKARDWHQIIFLDCQTNQFYLMCMLSGGVLTPWCMCGVRGPPWTSVFRFCFTGGRVSAV